MRKRGRRVEVTTYLLVEEDSDLIAYLQGRQNRSAAARRLLKAGFADEQTERSGDGVTNGNRKEVIAEVLAVHFNPALFRQIVEAGVRDVLTGLSPSTLAESSIAPPAVEEEEDDGLDAFVI